MSYREPEFLPWDGRRVPITFVGGYLGAGKTTVINDLLAQADRPIAVLVNDAGAVNIDARLIRKRHGDTIELTDGCICCGSIDDVGAAFDLLRSRAEPPDHVVVELSGVAEPQRMLPWGRSAGFMLDGVVVVVAADQLLEGAVPAWVTPYLVEQIQVADLLILTKTDLLDDSGNATASQRLNDLAPGTPVLLADRNAGASGVAGRFLSLGGRRPGGPTDLSAPSLFDAHETHTLAFPSPVTTADLASWLSELPNLVQGTPVRAKGLVDTTDSGLVLVQVVGTRHELERVPEPERQAPTDLVVITLRPEYSAGRNRPR